MSDGTVAETLGAHLALTSDEADPWYLVAHGKCSPGDVEARLLEMHDEVGEQEREAIERAKLVFAPVSAERREALLEALLSQREAERSEPRSSVVPLTARSRRAMRWIVGGLAIAASIELTLWLVPRGPADEPAAFVGSYGLVIDNPTAEVRGPEPRAEIPWFPLDAEIQLRLVPEASVEGPVAVRAFVLYESGEARPLELQPRVHPGGVVELELDARTLGLDQGKCELVFAVGREQALPASWAELAGGSRRAGYEVRRATIEIGPRT